MLVCGWSWRGFLNFKWIAAATQMFLEFWSKSLRSLDSLLFFILLFLLFYINPRLPSPFPHHHRASFSPNSPPLQFVTFGIQRAGCGETTKNRAQKQRRGVLAPNKSTSAIYVERCEMHLHTGCPSEFYPLSRTSDSPWFLFFVSENSLVS